MMLQAPARGAHVKGWNVFSYRPKPGRKGPGVLERKWQLLWLRQHTDLIFVEQYKKWKSGWMG